MPRPFAVIGFTVFFTIAVLYDTKTGVTAAVLAAFTVALVIALFSEKERNAKIIPAIAASGAIACVLLLTAEMFVYQPALSYDGIECEIKAVLTSECEERYGNYYYEAECITVDGEENGLKLRFTFSAPIEAEPYDLIEGRFRIFTLGSTSDEFMLSHKSKGIFMGAYSFSEKFNVIQVPESEKPFAKKIIDFRGSLKDAVYRVFPDNRGALAVALILGDKSRIPDDVLDDFNEVGITHLICISGFHLSLWSFLILKIFRKTGMNEKLANAFAIVGVIGFMLVAGLSYSVLRSGIMMLVYLLANIISRQRDSLNSLGFAITAIAVFNPFAMGALGLQLSALATLGLILYFQFFGEKVKNAFEKISPKPLGRLLHLVCEAILTTAAATAFILPVTLRTNNGFHFGIFLANPVAIPVSEACIVLGVIAAIVGLLPIYNFPAVLGRLFLDFLMLIADKTAELKFMSVKIYEETAFVVLTGLAVIVLVSLLLKRKGKVMPVLTCALCAVYFVCSLAVSDYISDRETRVNVLDCGNGMSVLIRSDGKNYLFGGGGTEFLGGMYLSDAVELFGGELETVVLPDTSEFNSCWFTDIIKEYKPHNVYADELPDGTKYLLDSSEKHGFSDFRAEEDTHIFCREVNGSRYAVFENGDISILICFDPIDYSSVGADCDLIVSRNDYPQGIQNGDCRAVVISSDAQRGEILADELSDKGIQSVFTGGNGNIIVRASNGALSIKREK